MESVVKNQPRKCLYQSQTFYRQVLPNSQGTHNSNFIHTVPENGKRKNIYQFILWGQYNQTKAIREGKITANLTHDMDKKKNPTMKLDVDLHSFIHSSFQSFNKYLLSVHHAPTGTVLINGELRARGRRWAIKQMITQSKVHRGHSGRIITVHTKGYLTWSERLGKAF